MSRDFLINFQNKANLINCEKKLLDLNKLNNDLFFISSFVQTAEIPLL